MVQQLDKDISQAHDVKTIHLSSPGNASLERGVHWLTREQAQFSIFVAEAEKVYLSLYNPDGSDQWAEFELSDTSHRTGEIWHVVLSGLPTRFCYGYQVQKRDGSFTSRHPLVDPYAKQVVMRREGSAQFLRPLGLVVQGEEFDWQEDKPPGIARHDLIIYEMHVNGFTRGLHANVSNPGTFLAVAEKASYLSALGVNAVELMPVYAYDPHEHPRCSTKSPDVLGNFWGYSPLNFFAPAPHFGSGAYPGCEVDECKEMIRTLHSHGIEVFLDVVYNHTAEGDHRGETYSFRGLADDVYYLKDSENRYMNFSGCGNTLNTNHPIVRELILDSLRYWVSEMHVDGFRFDLGSIFARDRYGHVLPYSPVLEAITEDPLLADVKLIAEPWDAVGLYQVGSFNPTGDRWSEWNDHYRDCVRRFINGDAGARGEFATRICGSQDIYGSRGGPCQSINFVTAHDGFTLADLVSYTEKRNLANGEGNRDGAQQNYSWNCGIEGETDDASVLARRSRQVRNFLVALLLSRGIPMLLMGDEHGHSRQGNNNAFGLNAACNWLEWQPEEHHVDFLRFVQHLTAFRRSHTLFRKPTFYDDTEVQWHGLRPFKPHWGEHSHYLALSLCEHKAQEFFYVAFNTGDEMAEFTLPEPPTGKQWCRVVDTAEPAPLDFIETAERQPLDSESFVLSGHSCIVLSVL